MTLQLPLTRTKSPRNLILARLKKIYLNLMLDSGAATVENCWHTARRHPPQFKYKGDFRGSLLRVPIDEALALRRKTQHLARADASLDNKVICFEAY